MNIKSTSKWLKLKKEKMILILINKKNIYINKYYNSKYN